MIDSSKLIDLLKQGIVEITFRSLKNQSISDKILCYDVEFEKVEDIDVSTIEKYVPLQRLS